LFYFQKKQFWKEVVLGLVLTSILIYVQQVIWPITASIMFFFVVYFQRSKKLITALLPSMIGFANLVIYIVVREIMATASYIHGPGFFRSILIVCSATLLPPILVFLLLELYYRCHKQLVGSWKRVIIVGSIAILLGISFWFFTFQMLLRYE
jgi:hypothetical protein